jgi:hypothetical protein
MSALMRSASATRLPELANFSWAIWLAVPVMITLLAALFLWWRGRPARPLRTAQTISGHRAYLDALTPGADRSLEGPSERAAEESQGSPG